MALTKAHNRMIEGASVSVKDFGAKWDGTTDDTVAVQACIDYAGANGCRVTLPSGTGCFSGVNINTTYHGISITGAGRGRPGNAGGVTYVKNNATTPMFQTSGGGTLPMASLVGMSFKQTDTTSGEFFKATQSVDQGVFKELEFALLNPAKSFMHFDCVSPTDLLLSGHYGSPAAGFSQSPYYIKSKAPGSYFNNVFEHFFMNGNSTATAPMMRIRDTSGGSTNGTNTFRNLIFELPATGGAIHASSIRHSSFENIFCDDSTATPTHHIIHLDKDVTAGSQESAYNTFTGCFIKEGDSSFKDIYVESAGPGTHTVIIGSGIDHINIEGPSYASIESKISNDYSGQKRLDIYSGQLKLPTATTSILAKAVQTGVTSVIAAGGNEAITFPTAFYTTPIVTVSQNGTNNKGGSAQTSGASTLGVTIYNHGTSSCSINWIAAQ
jgi:hypothetical protein